MLKKFLLTLLLIPLGTAFAETDSTQEETSRLQLEVSGIEEAKGELIIALFTCEKTYDSNDNPAYHVILPVETKGSVEYTFRELNPGTFAIKLFHDVNANGKLDTNWVGIPREPYGFSNNPRIRFGPPSFDATSFEVTSAEKVKHEVTLN